MKTVSRKSKKGVSPVIATIIIVAIAIVMSISVAYWMLGLGAAFTRFEKLEFSTAYATKKTTDFNITMVVKNTGSAPATIELNSTLLNGKPPSYYRSLPETNVSFMNITGALLNANPTLEPGQEITIVLWVNGTSFISGMTLEIMIHTAAGKDYPKVVILP